MGELITSSRYKSCVVGCGLRPFDPCRFWDRKDLGRRNPSSIETSLTITLHAPRVFRQQKFAAFIPGLAFRTRPQKAVLSRGFGPRASPQAAEEKVTLDHPVELDRSLGGLREDTKTILMGYQ